MTGVIHAIKLLITAHVTQPAYFFSLSWCLSHVVKFMI